MAAKTTKLASKNFELGSDLDFPSYDFDYGEPKKDSNPVLSTLKAIGKGAVGSVFNRGLVRSTIKNSLPDAYGQAYDFYDQAKESVRSLYNDAARELRPATNSLKATTRRFLPEAEGILPGVIAEKMKEWSKPSTNYSSLSTESIRNDALAMQLGTIFKAQAEDSDRKETREEKREQLSQGIEQIRHRDVLTGLNAVALGVSRLANYQDNVLANYQKKSLELQFRSYYVMADLLNETKRAAAVARYQAEAVVKNTGLPDFAKLKTSDVLKQHARNKFLEVGSNALFGGTGGADFVKNFIANIKKSVGEKLKGGAEGAGGLADILDTLGGVSDATGGMGPSKAEMAGEGFGHLAGWVGLKKAQEAARKRLEKHPGIQKGAEHLQYNINNAANRFSDALTNPDKEWDLYNARSGAAGLIRGKGGRATGLRGRLADMVAPKGPKGYNIGGPGLGETLRETLAAHLPSNAPDSKLEVGGLLGQNQPAVYSNAAQKSLIEVIPGLLARIQRELVVTRTGQDAGLIAYDYNTNKFSTQKAIGHGVMNMLASKDNRKEFDGRLNQILAEVDKEGKLTFDQVKGIKDKLADISMRRGSTDAKALSNPRTWAGIPGHTDVAKMFQEHLGADENGNRNDSLGAIRNQRVLSDRVSQLTKYFNDPRAQLQAMAALGQTDALHQSGVYNRKEGRLDLSKIATALRGEDVGAGLEEDETYVPVGGGGGRRPNQARRALEARRRANLANQIEPAPSAPIPAAPAPKPDLTAALKPQEVKLDSKELIGAIGAVGDDVKKLNHEDLFKKMLEELVGINAHLAEGINTYSLAEDYLGSGARQKIRDKFGRLKDRVKGVAGAAADKARGVKDKVSKSLSDITLGDLGGLAAKGVKGAFGHALNAAKGVTSLAGSAAKSVFSVAAPMVVGGTQKLADMFGDVYLPGEKNPRITRGDMKAGVYFDKATGKKITSFKDISGSVVDESGNLILDDDQVKVAYVKGTRVKALKEAISEAGGALKGLAGLAASALGGGYNLALRAAIVGFKTVQKMLPPYDVYVKSDMTKPKLRKQGFVDRVYISKKTGSRLTHPREIDGPVLDVDGNQLITQDDMDVGLVDVKGVTVTNKVGRLIGKVKGLATMGLGMLKGVLGSAKEFFVGIGQALKDVMGGIFGLRGEYLQTSIKQLDVQTAILKLLTDRMPSKKKHVLGDVDGDGQREGSAQEMEKAAAAEAKARGASQDVDPRAAAAAGGGGAGGLGLIDKMKSLFGKKKEGDDNGGGTNIDIDTGMGGKAAKEGVKDAEKLAARGAKGGLLRRMAGGLGRGLWGATKFAGRAGLGLLGLGGLGIGGAVSGLASGAAAVGGAALEGGVALAAGAGSALAAGATGLLAVLTAPVTLAVLGVAAVGVGAYMAYKYLTKVRPDTLSTVRYAQYGFPASDSQDHLAPIWDLEKMLEPITYIKDGKALFDGAKFDIDECMKIFKIEKASDTVKPWISWFTNRFKPVFFAHIATLRGIKAGVELHDVDSDKLTAQEKLNYLAGTSMPNGPFDYMASPFADLDNLTVGSDGVRSAIDIAQDQLKKDAAKEATKPKVAAAAAAAGAANAPTNGKAGATSLTAGAKSAMGTGAATAADAAAAKAAADLGGTVPTEATTNAAGVNLIATNSVPSDFLFTGQTGRIDALSTIRFKTYGLIEMDVDKIKNLRFLEMNVLKVLKIGKDGATYEEDIEALLQQVKGTFGITGPHSPQGLAWMRWFRNRFLPVYLNYATMVTKLTGKKDLVSAEMALTPQQQVDTANAVYTTSAVVEGSKISVWKVAESPWQGYALNDDPETVKANLQFLTEAVKAVKANEQMSTKVKDAQRANEIKGAAAGTSASQTDTAKAPDGKTDIIQRDKSSVDKDTAKLAGGVGFSQSLPMTPDGKGVRAIGDFTKGTPVEHPGKGTGGDINSLPIPTGDGYDAMKDLLAAVSKMTGVPLGPITTTAAVESGFRASAMPPVNPATGKRASGAIGLFQFIPSTWNMMLAKYGAKYGIAPGTPATDPRANALMGAEFLRENMTSLGSRLKKPLTNTDLYLAHFLGAGGAAQFLNSDPSAIAADAMPKAAAANPTIFYDTKRNNAPRTFGEIYALFSEKLNRETKKYGLSDTVTTASPADAKKDAAAAVTGDPTTNPATASTAAAGAGQQGGTVTSTATPSKPATTAVPAGTPTNVASTGGAALVNSSNAAGTAAGASSSSGYGASVSSARAPEATADTTAPTATAAPADAVTPAPVLRRPANFSGFQARLQPTPDEIAAQHAATAAATGGDIKSINATLSQSLDVQTQSLTQLTLMAKLLSKLNSIPVAGGTASNDTSSTIPAVPDMPRPAPKAPISMSRRN